MTTSGILGERTATQRLTRVRVTTESIVARFRGGLDSGVNLTGRLSAYSECKHPGSFHTVLYPLSQGKMALNGK